MKKSILYITYVDFENQKSGSTVRPSKIYEAFLKGGYNVKLLSGIASKENKKNRIKSIEEIKVWLESNEPDCCYIESPNDPILFKKDRNLIKKIHQKGIRIGYFYRDAYYKLGRKVIFESRKKTLKNCFKYLYYKFLFYRDEKFLNKYVDIVYFPSKTMSEYFNFKSKKLLPPAGEIVENFSNNKGEKVLIYVGGISKRYGIDIMLNALDFINRSVFVKLILVCRKEELKYINSNFLNAKWLQIENVFGKEKLDLLYRQSSIALLPKEKCVYNDFAISIKLYEYMSYGLPIISTDSFETNKIIEKYNIGIITSTDYKDFAKAILKLYKNDDVCENLSSNAKKAILDNNLWTDRVNQIVNDLK